MPVNQSNLKIKAIDDNEFKERRKDKERQKKYYDQHTKEMKDWIWKIGYGENVDGKWEPATVLEKPGKPRSYILKTENGRTYRWNRTQNLNTEVDEDPVIEISNDEIEEETSEENITVQSDDTLKDVKQKESEVNDTNERKDTNDTI